MAVVLSTRFPDFHGKRMKKPVSKSKAKEILSHGSVRGHKLSKKQKGLFGAIAGGNCFSCKGKMGKHNS